MRTAALVLAALTLSSTASADERTNRRRLEHVAATALGGALYLTVQYVVEPKIKPDTCTWCDPPGFDASIRNSLVWNDPKRADSISNLTGYVSAPIFAIGSLILASGSRDARHWVDDGLPVLEAGVAVSLLHHLAKFALPRERPAHHFGAFEVEDKEPNFAFWSGHTSLAFALAVSAGTVAHLRHYRAEPYIWAGGLALAGATGYLRIAADAHYFSDVTIGAIMGSLTGYAVPHLLHRDVFFGERATLAPTPSGISIVGRF
jgi:membrane-associated phospholipid phosphatase